MFAFDARAFAEQVPVALGEGFAEIYRSNNAPRGALDKALEASGW